MTSFGTAGYLRGSTHSTSRSGQSDSVRVQLDSSMANSTNCFNLKHGYNSSADGYIPGKLPLPNDYFPVPKLSAKEKRYLLGLAKHACKEVVYYSRQHDGPMKWLHLSTADGVDMFQGVDISGPNELQQDAKALTYLRGSCKIHATIDELSDFFKHDTPETLSEFTQTVGKDLLDEKTLLTLATPTLDNPKHYVAVKWTAWESPSKLARNRDFCYIECHDEFIDANTKRRGWVQSMHSIRLPFCPPLTQSHSLVRGSFYRSGYIFTESVETGFVDAVHTLHVDIKGNAPHWLKILTMKRWITNIAQVSHYFQRQRLIHEPLLGDTDLPAHDRVTRCQLCDTRFGFFRRRRLCRKCGKVACNSCTTEFSLGTESVGPTKVLVCVECSENGERVPMMDGSGRLVNVEKQEDQEMALKAEESMIYLETRSHSIDEHEYFFGNEDANALADIKTAKRTNLELLKETSEGMEAMTERQRLGFMTMASFEMKGAITEAETTSLSANALNTWEGIVDVRSDRVSKNNKMRKREYTSITHSSDDDIPPPRPRANGFVRSVSEDALPLNSKWIGVCPGLDYNTKCRSMELFDLSRERPRSRSRSSHEFGAMPSRCRCKTGIRSSHKSTEDKPEIFACQTRTQHCFEARNARTSTVHDSKVPRYRVSDTSTNSGKPVYRPSELKSPLSSLSDSNFERAFPTQNQQIEEFNDPKDEAFRLAMSAMRLYEEERGTKLHVAKETRQVALAKMVEVYAREIERSQSNDLALYSRGTISDTHRVHPNAGNRRRMRRTFGDDRPPYDDDLPMQLFRQDDRHVTSKRLSCQEDLYAPRLSTKSNASKEGFEYRDLSDLSTSAFQAFQKSSRGSSETLQDPVENFDIHDMLNQHEEVQPVTQRESTSFFHAFDTSALARNNSMESGDTVSRMLRSNSMFNVADSDTFSNMDLTDFPHFMCTDDDRIQARSSLTGLQHSIKEQSSKTRGLEDVQDPQSRDFIPSLHLDDVQYVEDDDGHSQSSTASSPIEWQTTISNEIPLGHAAVPHDNEAIIVQTKLSESMVERNEKPGAYRQNSKLPSLSNLLSKLCDRDRSSLPSYLEFGGSHAELKTEYLEAIAIASNKIIVSMKGKKQRRRLSIPSELEAMASREVCN